MILIIFPSVLESVEEEKLIGQIGLDIISDSSYFWGYIKGSVYFTDPRDLNEKIVPNLLMSSDNTTNIEGDIYYIMSFIKLLNVKWKHFEHLLQDPGQC